MLVSLESLKTLRHEWIVLGFHHAGFDRPDEISSVQCGRFGFEFRLDEGRDDSWRFAVSQLEGSVVRGRVFRVHDVETNDGEGVRPALLVTTNMVSNSLNHGLVGPLR